MATSEARYRLPRNVTPTAYRLTFEPDLDAARFDGSEEVDVTVHEPVTEIVLNANELTVHGGSLVAGDRTIEVEKVVPDAEAERVTLSLGETADPGAWTLRLTFAGELNDKLVGFYRSVYPDADGAERVIATTHFEATDARRAFPCWDEPDLKASFGITLVVREGLTALANGPEVEREALGDGRVRVRFADSMVMSTYLVCMVVGPLTVTEAVDARGVPVRVACVPGKEHLAGFALDTAVYSLNWFGDYYAIPYPDAKLDQVAIPDFAQGAMENLGLVTYRETLLLADPDKSTPAELLDVAETVAHELAHMWFGDLVTMRWWNGIWLNEAFATFMSYRCVDEMRPDWRVWDSFARNKANAFEVDALESTRTIEYPVHSPDDASGMFDTLTYTKGGAVLRMLEQWLGEDRFRDGIRRYLRTHAHANTETHDLWDAIEAETGEPVRRVMDAWIFQAGYPAITVAREGDELVFGQHRFLPSAPEDPTTWPVPLIVRQIHAGGEQVDRVLVEAEGLRLPIAADDAVVVGNAGGASFVRVFYDDELRERLVARAGELLTPIERQGLVDDAWGAAVAGRASAAAFIDLVRGFTDEDDPSVWKAIIGGLGWCDRFLSGAPRDGFRDAVRDLVRPALDRLGWDPRPEDSDLDHELRGDLILALGVLGDDPETQAQAREAEALGRNGGDVAPAVAAAAVEVVAATGGEAEYDTFWASYTSARTPQEEDRYLYALGRFGDPALMARTLEASMTDAIRPQNAPFLMLRATTNRDLGPQVWTFIADHWDAIRDRIAESNVIALAAGLRFITDPDAVASAQAFFEDHDIPQNRLMLRQFLERQRVMAAFRARAEDELAARFGG
ncbi:MAG TPA: M1 family metallopeptidase [Actinomycetota bacterium]|nr:M1 family metallopeptidase [Actinomycetota bacterium]